MAQVSCSNCGGSGNQRCHNCGGSGKDSQTGYDCSYCGGRGYNSCGRCNGSGYVDDGRSESSSSSSSSYSSSGSSSSGGYSSSSSSGGGGGRRSAIFSKYDEVVAIAEKAMDLQGKLRKEEAGALFRQYIDTVTAPGWKDYENQCAGQASNPEVVHGNFTILQEDVSLCATFLTLSISQTAMDKQAAGDFDGAIKAYYDAIKYQAIADEYDERYKKNGGEKKDESEEPLTVRRIPVLGSIYNERGEASEKAGNKDKAIEDYKTAIRLGYEEWTDKETSEVTGPVINLKKLGIEYKPTLKELEAHAEAEEKAGHEAVAEYLWGKAEAMGGVPRKARKGDAEAQWNYASRLGDGEEAIKWLTKAAERGHSAAQNRLGAIYLSGSGVPVDLDKAKYWLEKDKAHGDSGMRYTTIDMLKVCNKKLRERDGFFKSLLRARGISSLVKFLTGKWLLDAFLDLETPAKVFGLMGAACAVLLFNFILHVPVLASLIFVIGAFFLGLLFDYLGNFFRVLVVLTFVALVGIFVLVKNDDAAMAAAIGQTATLNQNTDMFRSASRSGGKVKSVNEGTIVTVTGKMDDWTPVEHDGDKGYLRKNDLVLNYPAELAGTWTKENSDNPLIFTSTNLKFGDEDYSFAGINKGKYRIRLSKKDYSFTMQQTDGKLEISGKAPHPEWVGNWVKQ